MSLPNPDEALELTVSRLYSQDANDRVKAASELGEIGTPEIAPKLLDVVYEDEASTVRQMAIQSYSEILGEDSLDEVIKAADSHFDEYVKLYAVMVLGRIGSPRVSEPLSRYIRSDNPKIKAAALKAMIHAETAEQGETVFEVLQQSDKPIIVRNCIEALALWHYQGALDYIQNTYFTNEDIKDLEIKTISAFYLASFGDKKGINYLETSRVDRYVRIKIDDIYYKGGQGLLEAARLLRS